MGEGQRREWEGKGGERERKVGRKEEEGRGEREGEDGGRKEG